MVTLASCKKNLLLYSCFKSSVVMKYWVEQRYACGYSFDKKKGPFGSEKPCLILCRLFQHQGQCCTEVRIITLNPWLCHWVGWSVLSVGNLNLCGLCWLLCVWEEKKSPFRISSGKKRQRSFPLNVFYFLSVWVCLEKGKLILCCLMKHEILHFPFIIDVV